MVRDLEEEVLAFLSDGQTWKVVEVEYNLGVDRKILFPVLIRLEREGKIMMGGYRGTGFPKFVHIGSWPSEEDKRLYGWW